MEERACSKDTMDLVVIKHDIGTLETNAQQILDVVKSKLEDYTIDNYSEDNIADAKKDKAELNKAKKGLNDERIRLEKEHMKPFENFKSLVNKACNLITDASGKIDNLVKDVENKAKDEKKAEISKIWNDQHFNLVCLADIFDHKWLNKTVSLSSVRVEIESIIKTINTNLALLDKIGEEEAKAFYLEYLDITKAMEYAEKLKEKREALKKAEEKPEPIEQEKQPEIQYGITAEQAMTRMNEQLDKAIQQPTKTSIQENDLVLERTFIVRCSEEKLIALSNFMNDNSIWYEKVEEVF